MTVCKSCGIGASFQRLLLSEYATLQYVQFVMLQPKGWALVLLGCRSCLTVGLSSAAAPKPDPGMLAAMHKYVNINPEEFPAAMVDRLQLQRLLPLAIDRAIFENLPALSERASSVACNTTAELILKVLPPVQKLVVCTQHAERMAVPSDSTLEVVQCSTTCHVVLSGTSQVQPVAPW